jgi:hypothetical protein
MDTQQIPTNVVDLIVRKNRELQNERLAKEQQVRSEKNAHIDTGRKILREKITKALSSAPEWIREYDRTEREFDDNYLECIGRGWDNLSDLLLRFSIPGLPLILHNVDAWMTASVKGDEEVDPYFDFDQTVWHHDLDEALIYTKSEMLLFEQKLIQRDEFVRARQATEEKYEQDEQETALKNQQSIRQEKGEVEMLFAELKNDPVAILLMKAFLQIRHERNMFEQLLADADEISISREEHNFRKAEELRRQAANMERKAEEERSRANELEDDLRSIKKKLDRAERAY